MIRRVTDQSRGCGHSVREVSCRLSSLASCGPHTDNVLCSRPGHYWQQSRAPPPPPRLINPQCHKRPPPPPRALRRLHHVWFKIIPTIEFRYRLVLKLPNQLAKYLTIEEDLCAAICTMGNNFGMVERNILGPVALSFAQIKSGLVKLRSPTFNIKTYFPSIAERTSWSSTMR